MKEIELEVLFGNEIKGIKIYAPHDAARVYHVTINNYFNGQLVKTELFGWEIYLNHGTVLQGDYSCTNRSNRKKSKRSVIN